MHDAQPRLWQAVLALTPPEPCRRCEGTGEAYYLPRPGVIGGKRVVCPECGGSGMVGAAER